MAIVIVDDSVTNLVVLKHMAKKVSGGGVIMFSDGATALDYLGGASSELVIVDCEMPTMDGVAIVERIRQMEPHSCTPILMVTHYSDPAVRLRALKAGCNDFLSKPVQPEEFRIRVAQLLALTTLVPVAA